MSRTGRVGANSSSKALATAEIWRAELVGAESVRLRVSVSKSSYRTFRVTVRETEGVIGDRRNQHLLARQIGVVRLLHRHGLRLVIGLDLSPIEAVGQL